MQGMTVDQYLQYTGLTREALVDQMKPQAETRIKNRLVLEAIAKAENIEVSDEEVEAEMQKMADAGTLTTINAEKLDLSNVGPIASQIMKLHSDMTGLFVFYDVALGSVVGNEYNNTVQGIMLVMIHRKRLRISSSSLTRIMRNKICAGGCHVKAAGQPLR